MLDAPERADRREARGARRLGLDVELEPLASDELAKAAVPSVGGDRLEAEEVGEVLALQLTADAHVVRLCAIDSSTDRQAEDLDQERRLVPMVGPAAAGVVEVRPSSTAAPV